jgi:CDP-diacylglycerol---glycerol-3-phosphate 3-phosphatidyltransferase
MFTQKFQAWVRKWAERLVSVFRDSPVTPNMLTLFGLVITAAGAGVLAFGNLGIAGVILLFAGLFDILDGALARASGKVYKYGAFLDSTVDRYSEGLIYLGLLIFFRGQMLQTVLVLLALAGSFLVSYVRARAQSLGFTCDVGVLARPERVVIIVAGLLLDPLLDPILPIGGYHVVLTLAVVVLAVGTNFTAVQRVWVVWQQNRDELRAQRRRPTAVPADEAAGGQARPAKRRFFETW